MDDNKVTQGATIWARQTIESEIFYYKPDKWFKIWFYIVNKVNHKNTKLFERGTNLITYKEIQDSTKATKNQIDKFLRWAKSAYADQSPMLTTRKTTRGMIVTVCNYNRYQDLQNYKRDTQDDSPVETQTKRRRFTDDTINNNDNNENIYIHPLQIFVKNNYPKISKLETQLTYDNCVKLTENYKKDAIKSVLDEMENYAKLKNYTSVYLTLNNWLKRRPKSNQDSNVSENWDGGKTIKVLI